jgi:hypothetical protein
MCVCVCTFMYACMRCKTGKAARVAVGCFGLGEQRHISKHVIAETEHSHSILQITVLENCFGDDGVVDRVCIPLRNESTLRRARSLPRIASASQWAQSEVL